MCMLLLIFFIVIYSGVLFCVTWCDGVYVVGQAHTGGKKKEKEIGKLTGSYTQPWDTTIP